MVSKWDDMEVELTSDPKTPPSPSWDQRMIESLTKPGRKPSDPKARRERRRRAVQRLP